MVKNDMKIMMDDLVTGDGFYELLNKYKNRKISETDLLRILWKPSLKKDIKKLEKDCGYKEYELDNMDDGSNLQSLIDEVTELLTGKVSKNDMKLFLGNCENVWSYLQIFDKVEKIKGFENKNKRSGL
jgi:hypothetical protein